MLSPKQLRELVNDKISLVNALRKYDRTGHYEIRQPCFCPFHLNTETPAASIYEDAHTGKETLYCFAEQKQYTSSDVLENLLNYDIYEIGNQVWETMNTQEQQHWLEEHQYISYKDIFSKSRVNTQETNKNTLKEKEMYKYGKITLHELLDSMLDEKGFK